MNKKKTPAILAVCALLCCSAFSCGSKDSSSSVPEASSQESSAAETEEAAEADDETEPEELLIIEANANAFALKAAMEKYYEYKNYEYARRDGATDEEYQDYTQDCKGVYIAAATYMNAVYNGDAEAAFAAVYPEAVFEEVKNLDAYKDAAAGMNKRSEDDGDELLCNIEELREFDDEQLKAVEDRYNAYARGFKLDREYRVTEGYYFDLTAGFGDELDAYDDMKAVYVEDEGWKIFKLD